MNHLSDYLDDNTGPNNQKVYPKTERRTRNNMSVTLETTAMDRIKALSKPMKLMLHERHKSALTKDPENKNGHKMLRAQYSLP